MRTPSEANVLRNKRPARRGDAARNPRIFAPVERAIGLAREMVLLRASFSPGGKGSPASENMGLTWALKR